MPLPALIPCLTAGQVSCPLPLSLVAMLIGRVLQGLKVPTVHCPPRFELS